MKHILVLLLTVILCHACLGNDPLDVPDRAQDIDPLGRGDRAPGFVVVEPDGSPFRFSPGGRESPTLIIFYRGGWCPYCNSHLSELRHAEDEILAMGYEVLFISADRPDLLYSSLKDETIDYRLLSDSDMQAARAFGIAFRVSDEGVAKLLANGHDIEAASGRSHHILPVPSVFIVDRAGVIRFSHANPDYKVRLSADELLVAARGLSPE